MLYFAYGSNLSLKQMRHRCPGAKPLRKHRLAGYRLVLRGVANIEPAPGEHCEGAIYEVTPECEAVLDSFEGVPTLYDKHFFETEDGPVMFYRMVEPHYKPPREGYVETIEAGYRDWELPEEGLERAKTRQIGEYGAPA
jgi:gamma-glutamylcyclotransferase (GGCT)/AIG2-like uncharacterized protein YtfP